MHTKTSYDRLARVLSLLPVVAGMLLLVGCESPSGLVGPDRAQPANLAAGAISTPVAGGVTARASGGGLFHLDGLAADVEFAFTAVQQSTSGNAIGNYHFASLDGFSVNIHGRVTCLNTDPANPGRAWMGGEITKNESQHPFFMGENSRVGKDGWFRVVDYGEGGTAAQPDRTTLVFFEPAGGFTSAEQFCASRLWFPEDRLTNPLFSGNIQVGH